jgi:hypothetical protein
MDSEHNIAREDREGSGIELGFILMSPVFFLKFFSCEIWESQAFPSLAKYVDGHWTGSGRDKPVYVADSRG